MGVALRDANGKSQRLPSGVAATNECPGCCGEGEPDPKCCICANPSAPIDDPCAINYGTVKGEPPKCNPAPSCCCGSRVRMTWKRVSTFDSKELKKANGNFQSVHIEYEQIAVFEWNIVTLPEGKCREDYTPISYKLRILDRRNNHFGGNDHFSETLETSDDKNLIAAALGQLVNPHHGCRPEPVWMACKGGVPLYVELFDDDNEQNPSWCASLFTHGCTGKGSHFGDDGKLYGVTEWTGTAACKQYRFDAKSDYHLEDFSLKVDRVGTGYAEMTLETLEDECCPPPGGATPSPDTPGSSNPSRGNQGALAACPRCFTLMYGNKCSVCSYCFGCGG